jgi:DME family drug/metabolite transporter
VAQLSTETRRPASATRHPFASALLVLAGAGLFGTVGTAQAMGPDAPASALAAARMAATALVFVLLAVAVGRRREVAAVLRTSPAWWAGLGQGFFNLCFLAAMKEAGVAVGTLVAIGATPVVTGLITRQVSRGWLGATAVAVAGLALLVAGQQGTATPPSTVGVLLAVGAATSYATYIIAGNAAEARGLPTGPFLAGAFSVSALVTLPWLLTGDLAWLGTVPGMVLLGFLVGIPTLLAYSLFNRGLRGVRSSTAATLALIEPVVAAALAFLLLGERLGVAGTLGAALILVGLLLIVRTTAAAEKNLRGA